MHYRLAARGQRVRSDQPYLCGDACHFRRSRTRGTPSPGAKSTVLQTPCPPASGCGSIYNYANPPIVGKAMNAGDPSNSAPTPADSAVEKIRAELEKLNPSTKQRILEKFALAALGMHTVGRWVHQRARKCEDRRIRLEDFNTPATMAGATPGEDGNLERDHAGNRTPVRGHR